MEWIPFPFLPPTSSSSSSIFGGYKLPRNQLLSFCNNTQIEKFSPAKYNLSSSLPELLNKPNPQIFYFYFYFLNFWPSGVSFNLHALEEFE